MGAVQGHMQSPKGMVPQRREEALSTAGLGAAWEPWPGLSAGLGPLSGGIPRACASLSAESRKYKQTHAHVPGYSSCSRKG